MKKIPSNQSRPLRSALILWLIFAILGHFTLDVLEHSAYVLCFGVDGHVAMERAGHDHRLEKLRAVDQTVIGQAMLQKADPPCVDIPVASDDHGSHTPFSVLWKDFADVEWVALAALCFILLPFIRTAVAVIRSHSPPLLDSRLLLRRSVVLLI
jgi:hypothetical protein